VKVAEREKEASLNPSGGGTYLRYKALLFENSLYLLVSSISQGCVLMAFPPGRSGWATE